MSELRPRSFVLQDITNPMQELLFKMYGKFVKSLCLLFQFITKFCTEETAILLSKKIYECT